VPLAAVAKYIQSAKRQNLMALSAERHEKKNVQPLFGTAYSGGIVTLLCNGQIDRLCKEYVKKKCNVENTGFFFSCLADKCRTDALVSSYWLLPMGSFV